MRLAKIIFLVALLYFAFWIGQLSISKKFIKKVFQIRVAQKYDAYFQLPELVNFPKDTIFIELPVPTDTLIVLLKK
jgi:hypothetical protein